MAICVHSAVFLHFFLSNLSEFSLLSFCLSVFFNAFAFQFNFTDGARCFVMMFDTRFICDGERISEGEISVIDMSGCTLGHVAKMTWRELRIIATAAQDGLPAKIKSVHYLNCPPFMGKVMRVLKWFLKSEIIQSVSFNKAC